MKKFRSKRKIFGECLVLIFGIAASVSSLAQNTITYDGRQLKKRIFKTSVFTSDSKKSTGFLGNISDSTLYLASSAVNFGSLTTRDPLAAYPYNHMEMVRLQRKGAALRGAWKGALIGSAAGVIAGLVSGNDPVTPYYNNPNDPYGAAFANVFIGISNAFTMTAGEKAALGGIAGAFTGAIIGAIVGGLAKKKFTIGRKKEKFHDMRQTILEKMQVK